MTQNKNVFEQLPSVEDDSLLALIGLFNSDQRSEKVDLGVGVYRNEEGRTPVMRAVKAAEARLQATEETKTYIGPRGDAVFLDLLWELAMGDRAGLRFAGVQTPGGSGALRLASDLLAELPSKRIWLGTPTWPNHPAVFRAAGLEIEVYPFFDVGRQQVHFEAMTEALRRAEPGDAVLLHATSHNPTGTFLSEEEWSQIGDLLAERGLVPLLDSAYQGFGNGLVEDAIGLRTVLPRVPQALIAFSCSKSFGIYRERTGALFAIAPTETSRDRVQSNLVVLARTNYSMPPSHGAAVVRTILGDEDLKADWATELSGMRRRLTTNRQAFARQLAFHRPELACVGDQTGMFSLLPLSADAVLRLRKDHAIYMPANGRVNLAGLRASQVEAVADRLGEAM